MLLTLDEFVFELGTLPPQTYALALELGWVKQDRYRARPAYQFTGVRGETLTLAGVLYPTSGVTGTNTDLSTLKEMALAGQDHVLASGDGYVHGLWAIATVRESHSELLPMGAAQVIEFEIDLVRTDDGRTERLPALRGLS
ncbi:MAG: phage tail protein [Litorimonas sp.]